MDLFIYYNVFDEQILVIITKMITLMLIYIFNLVFSITEKWKNL